MRTLISICLLAFTGTAAGQVLWPTTILCELALRTAETSPREIDRAGAQAMWKAYQAYLATSHWYAETLSNVRGPGVVPPRDLRDHLLRPISATDGVVAREFVGAEEIAPALAHLRKGLGTTGRRLRDALDHTVPPCRPSELVRLATWTALGVLPVLVTGGESDYAHASVTLAATYLNDRRRRQERERVHGVPRLGSQLALLDRALDDQATLAPGDRRRVLSVATGRVLVSRATHEVLFARDRASLTAAEFGVLVQSARPFKTEWTDFDPAPEYMRQLAIESVVFTEATARNPRLRWMILVRSARPRPEDALEH